MTNHLTMCLGGTRSGKSDFAENLAQCMEGRKLYLATMPVLDEEMKFRVERHRERRGNTWKTLEVCGLWDDSVLPYIEKADVILLDSLTMITSNFLMEKNCYCEDFRPSSKEIAELLLDYEKEIHHMISDFRKGEGKTVIVVSDEVGLGIVPENLISRIFRDFLGIGNQVMAGEADKVYFTLAGITRNIKDGTAVWQK